ncbi:MAG: NlpC/P60 family protein [Sphingopyxis sp.]
MDNIAERAWRAALKLLGIRYRLHGRVPQHGLDCVGLVACAYQDAGLRFKSLPDDYRLHCDERLQVAGLLEQSGFDRADEEPIRHGDVALIHVGRGQQHLILLSPDAHIHAHAGLRRVVLTPGAPDGDHIGRWRWRNA